jgi:hypothetical protein
MNPTQWIWRKSSRSATDGQCVEVACPGHIVAIRDSKNPAGGHLTIHPAAHAALVRILRNVH